MARGVAVVTFLTPVSNVMIRYSILFGYPPALAGSLVNASTVVSFFILWAFLALMAADAGGLYDDDDDDDDGDGGGGGGATAE